MSAHERRLVAIGALTVIGEVLALGVASSVGWGWIVVLAMVGLLCWEGLVTVRRARRRSTWYRREW